MDLIASFAVLIASISVWIYAEVEIAAARRRTREDQQRRVVEKFDRIYRHG